MKIGNTVTLLTMAVLLASVPAFAGSVTAPDLDGGSSFGLIGGTVSNTGTSVVIGNVGAMT